MLVFLVPKSIFKVFYGRQVVYMRVRVGELFGLCNLYKTCGYKSKMISFCAPKSLKLMSEPVSADMHKLSSAEIKFYWDNGYLVVKKLIDQPSLNSYRKRFIQICNGEVGKGNITVVKEPALAKKGAKGENLINKLQDILYDDVLSEYTENQNLLSVISQIIGDHITAMHSMLINKPPGSSRHPPHQDLFYFPFRPADRILAAWTAIDQVTLDNGCLYVLPGSHKPKELYEHGNLQDTNYLYHGITKESVIAPIDKRLHLAMEPGDTVFFHPLLVHGSGANITKNYRKSITCHFANSVDCYYVDVRGTLQEKVAQEVEDEAKRRGFSLTFQQAWQYRSKPVKGTRCNL